jgi:hypothetical protein
MHELGHLVGLEDLVGTGQASNLMNAWLTPGTRRLPAYPSASLVVFGPGAGTPFPTLHSGPTSLSRAGAPGRRYFHPGVRQPAWPDRKALDTLFAHLATTGVGSQDGCDLGDLLAESFRTRPLPLDAVLLAELDSRAGR